MKKENLVNKSMLIGLALGILLTSLLFFISGINDNGRYIPIATRFSDVYACILDTRTGVIYYQIKDDNDKFSTFNLNITEDNTKDKK